MPAVAGVSGILIPPEVGTPGRDVPGAIWRDRPVGRPAHNVAVNLIPIGGRGGHGGRVAAGQQRRVDPSGTAHHLVGHSKDHHAAPPVVVEVVVADHIVIAARNPQAGADGNRDRGHDVGSLDIRIEVVRVEVVVLDQVGVLGVAGVSGCGEDIGRESQRVVIEVVVVDVGRAAVGAGVAA